MKINSSVDEPNKTCINNHKLFVGRYYASYNIPKYEHSLKDGRHTSIVMGPDRKLYYKFSNLKLQKGDLVLFSLKEDCKEIDFIVAIKNCIVIENHEESDNDSTNEIMFYWNWKTWITPENNLPLDEIYKETFTDTEFEIIKNNSSAIILPRHWGHGIFLSICVRNTIKLFMIDTDYEDFIKLELNICKLRDEKFDLKNKLNRDPYDPTEFSSLYDNLRSEIIVYVDNIDKELLVRTYNVKVKSSYYPKSGGDDMLYASYESTCDVEFDNYLKHFFTLPESFSSRGYCNLYSCDDWKYFRDQAPVIQKNNIELFLKEYNRDDHISFLLYERLSKPFLEIDYILSKINYIDEDIYKQLLELDKYFPHRILDKYCNLFKSRKDLLEIVCDFNNRDNSKYRFGII